MASIFTYQLKHLIRQEYTPRESAYMQILVCVQLCISINSLYARQTMRSYALSKPKTHNMKCTRGTEMNACGCSARIITFPSFKAKPVHSPKRLICPFFFPLFIIHVLSSAYLTTMCGTNNGGQVVFLCFRNRQYIIEQSAGQLSPVMFKQSRLPSPWFLIHQCFVSLSIAPRRAYRVHLPSVLGASAA